MQSIQAQRGLSVYGWLLVLSIAGFFIMCAFKLIPIYSENMYVTEILTSLGSRSDFREMEGADIRSQLAKTFDLNGVRGAIPQNVEILRMKDRNVVNIDYEIRVDLIYNIDFVVSFENQLDATNPGACCKKLIADVKK